MNPVAKVPSAPSLKEIYAQQAEAAKQKSTQFWEARAAEGRAALTKNPLDSDGYIEVAQCLINLHKQEEAIAHLEEGLARNPLSERLHETRIALLEKCNQTREAIEATQNALRIFPDNTWMKMKEALVLPVVYSTDEEVETYRSRFADGLRKLGREISLDTPRAKSDAFSAIASHVNLGLGYQARDDRALQMEYGELVRRIVAAKLPEFTRSVAMP